MVLPQSMRLKGYRCFDYLHKEATRYHGSFMLLRVVDAKPNLLISHQRKISKSSIRCCISISNKVSKKSVIRNNIRRRFHEHLRLRLEKRMDAKERWAFLSLKPTSIKEHPSTLLKECDKLLFKAGLIS